MIDILQVCYALLSLITLHNLLNNNQANIRDSQAAIINVPPTGITFDSIGCFPFTALMYSGVLNNSCPTMNPPAAIFKGMLGVPTKAHAISPMPKWIQGYCW